MKVVFFLVILCAATSYTEAAPIGVGDLFWSTAKDAVNTAHKYAWTTINAGEQLVNEHGASAIAAIKTAFQNHNNRENNVLQALANTSKQLVQEYALPAVNEVVDTFSAQSKLYDSKYGE